MKPLQKGKETGIVEIPANWYEPPKLRHFYHLLTRNVVLSIQVSRRPATDDVGHQETLLFCMPMTL